MNGDRRFGSMVLRGVATAVFATLALGLAGPALAAEEKVCTGSVTRGLPLGEVGRPDGTAYMSDSLQQEVRDAETRFGRDSLEAAEALSWLSGQYMQAGHYIAADTILRREHAIKARFLGPGHPDVLFLMVLVASNYQRWGRHAEAEAIMQDIGGVRGSLNLAQASVFTEVLAAVFEAQGRYGEAEDLLVREVMTAPFGGAFSFAAINLVHFYDRRGRYDDAVGVLEGLIERETAHDPAGTRTVVDSLLEIARFREKQGRYDEARA